VLRPPGQESPRGGKMNILNAKVSFSALNKFEIIQLNRKKI
jgi:hypothetical protein